jgi:hypothetical protein
VLHPPLSVNIRDAPLGVLRDLAASVGAEPRVVVDRVIGEVRGDQIGVAGIERLVVGANVFEVADDEILTCACRSWALLFVVRVRWRKGAARIKEAR